MTRGRARDESSRRAARKGARQGTWRTGEVARAAGLSRQTVHHYELLGLIRPAGRTPGGHRLFSSRVFRQLDEIQALKRDHTLAEIREVFARRTRRRGPGAGRGRGRGGTRS